MKPVIFTESSSKKLYIQYMILVENSIKNLNKDDSKDILMEITNHIYEATREKREKSETDTLIDVLAELGDPYEFLKPIVADKMLNRAYKTFNLLGFVKALFLGMGNAISYFLLFVFSLLFIGSAFSLLLKIILPLHTGLFMHNDGGTSFGFIDRIDGTKEVLGWFYFPIIILITLFFYFLILTIFKTFRKSTAHAKKILAK